MECIFSFRDESLIFLYWSIDSKGILVIIWNDLFSGRRKAEGSESSRRGRSRSLEKPERVRVRDGSRETSSRDRTKERYLIVLIKSFVYFLG